MRACEGCRKRKIKCDAATTNSWPCSACARLKIDCIPPSLSFDGEASTDTANPGEITLQQYEAAYLAADDSLDGTLAYGGPLDDINIPSAQLDSFLEFGDFDLSNPSAATAVTTTAGAIPAPIMVGPLPSNAAISNSSGLATPQTANIPTNMNMLSTSEYHYGTNSAIPINITPPNGQHLRPQQHALYLSKSAPTVPVMGHLATPQIEKSNSAEPGVSNITDAFGDLHIEYYGIRKSISCVSGRMSKQVRF